MDTSEQMSPYSALHAVTWMSLFPRSPPGQIHQREQEIAELKQKIAEVMAVMPSLSYSSDSSNLSPVTPHYSSKFMDNSPSSLDPNASVYQPLKKWLWHPHFCQTELCLFLYLGEALSFSFGLFLVLICLPAPESFCTLNEHIMTHTQCTQPFLTCAYLAPFFWFYYENYYFHGGCVQNWFLNFWCWVLGFSHLTTWSVWRGRKEHTVCRPNVYRRAIVHRFVLVFFRCQCELPWQPYFLL